MKTATGARRGERLIEVGDDIVDMLDTDRQPDHFWPHAGLVFLVDRHLAMRRRGRMASERFGITHIDQALEQLQGVVKILCRNETAGDAESEQRTGATAEIFPPERVM